MVEMLAMEAHISMSVQTAEVDVVAEIMDALGDVMVAKVVQVDVTVDVKDHAIMDVMDAQIIAA